jgi:hypothetical protein
MPLEEFFVSWQAEYLNLLDSCGLLHKFTPDSKKLLVYCFLKNMNNLLHDRRLVFYHNHILSTNLEIFNYVDYASFNLFFDKLARRLKKLTGKIFFIQNLNKIPKRIEYFQNLDGAVQDELLLIQDFEPNPKKIKEYLASLKLKDIFQEMTWKLY